MLCLLDICTPASTKLSDLSSVLGAGLSLFLALAVIQTLGSVGMTRLRRKAHHLRGAVRHNKLDGLRPSISNVEAELSRLELSLETLSTRLFYITFIFILFSLVGLALAALVPSTVLNCGMTYSIILFNLVLPPSIFVLASLIIRVKSRSAREAVTCCENEVLSHLGSTKRTGA